MASASRVDFVMCVPPVRRAKAYPDAFLASSATVIFEHRQHLPWQGDARPRLYFGLLSPDSHTMDPGG
jgi:hypothetical protein